MAKTLEQIIAELEKQAEVPTPAEDLATTEEESFENQVDENDELREKVAEYDAAGRIMARGFYDEWQKLAVGVVGMTPNTGEEGDNPAVQLSNGEIQQGEVAQVVGTLRQMTQGAEANMSPGGKIENQLTGQVSPTSPSVQHNPSVAADVKKQQELAVAEKTSSAEVVGRLFDHYFGM